MKSKRPAPRRPSTWPDPLWIDRDQSILAFNARVLHWAQRPDVPVLERLRYLCIVSSNLDEFFEVRAMAHTPSAPAQGQADAAGSETFRALHSQAQALVASQYRILNDALWPALRREGIAVVAHAERTAQQRAWVSSYFERLVAPLLAPIALDPAHPFPRVANKSLHFIVELSDTDARAFQVAIVRVPRQLPRLIRLPERVRTARAKNFGSQVPTG